MTCENGNCTFVVHGHRDAPNDPLYPIVVCPLCMTRWYGHRDDQVAKPIDPRIPSALRDTLLLDQADSFFEILENELGYTKTVRPNAILGASVDQIVLPNQTASIRCAPQCYEFLPTHFVTLVDGFTIDDVRLGNMSLFIHGCAVSSNMFRMVRHDTELRLKPGDTIGSALIDVVGITDEDLMPAACSAFRWAPCLVGEALNVYITNVSDVARAFDAVFLGRQRSRPIVNQRG